jgi:hypothetical protein
MPAVVDTAQDRAGLSEALFITEQFGNLSRRGALILKCSGLVIVQVLQRGKMPLAPVSAVREV